VASLCAIEDAEDVVQAAIAPAEKIPCARLQGLAKKGLASRS
jgi:hypothetical protein